jgi:hypothetical protein
MKKEERNQAVAQKTKELGTRTLLQTGIISGDPGELPVPAQIVTPPGAVHKTKRLMRQCINVVSSNPRHT